MSLPCPALGFRIRFVNADAAALREIDRALHARLGAEGLGATRSGGEWLVRREGAQTTEADRELVARWLAQHEEARAVIGPLVDLGDD